MCASHRCRTSPRGYGIAGRGDAAPSPAHRVGPYSLLRPSHRSSPPSAAAQLSPLPKRKRTRWRIYFCRRPPCIMCMASGRNIAIGWGAGRGIRGAGSGHRCWRCWEKMPKRSCGTLSGGGRDRSGSACSDHSCAAFGLCLVQSVIHNNIQRTYGYK